MRILVTCEESQTVLKAFRQKSQDAWSNDILPASGDYPQYHLQCDALEALKDKWDMVIGHPPCTRLSNSGVLRLYKDGKKENGIDPIKWAEMEAGALFFKAILDTNCPKVCIENPIPHGYALSIIGRKYSQIIQPYNFYEDASKATCLWLKGLPLLRNGFYFPPRIVDGKKRWGNQTDSGQNKLPPSADRAKIRSVTYTGIARAMADQWG